MAKLQGIGVSGIRGFPNSWSSIAIGAQGLVVYGDNGTGKSSIVDALEYLLSPEVTLFSENRKGVCWDDAVQHVRCKSYGAFAIVKSNGNDYKIGSSIDIKSLPKDIQDFIYYAKASKFVFRRHKLISFIANQPKDRYTALESFLNLDEYSKIESHLKQILDRVNNKRTTFVAEYAGNESIVRRTLFEGQQREISDDSVLKALNEHLAVAKMVACTDIKDASNALRMAEEKASAEISGERLGAISALKSTLQRMPIIAEILPHAESLVEAVAEFVEARNAATEEGLIEWLIKGHEVVTQDTTESCPLCKQPVDRQELLAQLDERINSNRKYVDAKRHFISRSGEFCAIAKQFLDVLPLVLADWKSIVGAEPPIPLAMLDEHLKEAVKKARSMPSSIEPIRGIVEGLRIDIPIDAYIKEVDDLFIAEGGAQRQAMMAAITAAESVVRDYPKVVACRQQVERIEQHYSELSRLVALATEVRKSIVQEIFEKIAQYANEFYAHVHPNEAIGNSRLAVKKATDKSVNLTADFYGNQEHPMLHYSESHLDTLGLCYFLAVRRYEASRNSAFKVLVLDDVLTSVDANHRNQIALLLKDKFSDHQIIITTHDKLFYDRLKTTFSGMPVKYAMICSWDIDRGPVLIHGYSDIDKIRAPMRDTETQEDLSIACGRLAECLLRDFADGIRCPVPFHADGKYTFAELWNSVKPKLDKQNGFKATHVALATTFESCAWVRNECGAHFNAPAASVTMAEAREFAIQLEKLYDALICSKCGRIVFKIQGTEDWRCKCGALEYKHK